jgi:2-methylcitrate dehydratase PrpD
MTYAEKLSKFLSTLNYDDIPAKKINEVKEMLLDWVSCIYGGTMTESGRIAAKFARDFSENGRCTVVGLGYKSAPYNAAFANGILSHSIELDDIDVLAYFHHAPPVASAAFAAAEWGSVCGKTFLTGLAAGFEIMNRVSEAVNPSLKNRGYHTTPSCGVFGAGVAAGRMLDLNADQLTSVFGLCGAQASGLMEMYGKSMQKRFNPGPAARNGVTAALFAQRGFTGAETIFEGKRGFAQAFSDKYDLEKLTANLGKNWTYAFEYKPYACARPLHNAIDCALNIRKEHKFEIEDIKSIVMKRNPEWASYHNIKEPGSYHEAQVSLPFATALALVLGKVFVDQFSDENLKNPRIMGVSKMVNIEPDTSLPRGVSCNMIVTLKNGEIFSSQVDYPKGSLQNPLNWEERITKFKNLSSHLLSASERQAIVDCIGSIETIRDISEFATLLS